MKTELTEINPSRKRVTVEVPQADVQAVFQEILREYRRKASIPGFRPGHAPLHLVRQRIGDELGKEAAEKIVENFTREALRRENLQPVRGGVMLELGDQESPVPAREEDPYSFTLTVDVIPRIEPRDYTGQAVARPKVEVTEQEIQQELERFRESLGQLQDITDRPSQKGDLVAAELEGAELGQPPAIEKKLRVVTLGDSGNLPEFERALGGVRAGDDLTFPVTYPEDYPEESLRGRMLYFRGQVKAVKRVEVPELTDALIKEATGEIESLAALRERVAEAVTARQEREADAVVRQRLLEKLLDAHPFEAPEALVEQELHARLEDIGRQLAARGIDPDKVQIDWAKVVEDERKNALRAVRATLFLEAVAAKEGLAADEDEVNRAIAALARQGEKKLTLEQARAKLAAGGGLESLRRETLRRQCLDWLVGQAKIH